MTTRDPTEPGSGGETMARQRRVRQGVRAEWLAEAFVRVRAYKILARRYRTPVGEIDLIAVRGRRVAFIEVKRRNSFAACEASITAKTRARARRAASIWLARHPAYVDFDVGFDVIFITPVSLPRWLRDAL